jgi:hypothetical protein
MANTLISIVTVLAALGPGSEPSAPCNESIRQQDLKADLYFLGGDAFQGRLTGTAGNNLAAEFIASRFERLGLKRIGSDGSYFQPFLLSTATLGPSNKLEVTSDCVSLRFRAGQDFVPLPICPVPQCRTPWPSPASASATRSAVTTTTRTLMCGTSWSWSSLTSRARTIPRVPSTAWS